MFKAVLKKEDFLEDAQHGVGVTPMCSTCALRTSPDALNCTAFPAGIPLAILSGQIGHDFPVDVDNGVTYVPISTLVQKANPYHDESGKFTSKENASQAWKAVPHSQLGSNEGGVYFHGGVKKYVKFAKNPDQAESEATSARIHEMMGINTTHPQVVEVGGRKAVASDWVEGLEPLRRSGWDKLTPANRAQAADAFMAGVLTKNWDVVGLAYDNLTKNPGGDLVLVDTGGSFEYRAQGGHKTFDSDISGEVSSFLSPEKTSGRVYAPLLQKHPEVFVKAAQRLRNVSDKQLKAAVMASGMKDKKRIAAAIVQRKEAIIDLFNEDNLVRKDANASIKAWQTRERSAKSLSGKDAIKSLTKAGWVVDRVKGSHHIMKKPGHGPVPVPMHGKDLGIGLLKKIEAMTGHRF